jgi:hypothetical protein
MDDRISREARGEVLEAVRGRYRQARKKEKTKILDEVVALMNCHRKHAIRLLTTAQDGASEPTSVGKRIYDEAVREALIVIWEAADRICGKRLKAVLPALMESLELHGHLQPTSEVRDRLLSVSAATIDRLLAPIRSQARSGKKRRSKKKSGKAVAIRTFDDWNDPAPGFLEIDFVVHCGGMMAGTYIHSLAATDICSGWTEAVPLLVREQALVVEGLELMRRQLPIRIVGIDSDNDSAFINDTLVSYCNREQIEFTRSRPYHKNDQAWIEQKNGAVIRRFVGHERFSGVVAGQVLSQLYQAVRLYVNYFQPSFKLLQKCREGSRVKKSYRPPATPCDRLLAHDGTPREVKDSLISERSQLDPIELLHRIRTAQSALAAISADNVSESPGSESLDQFLTQLPYLWKSGETRPTHRRAPGKPHTWRTRKDPFETVWPEVLSWLQKDPETTAKALFERLQQRYPEQFKDGQLRTLQRRVREWRQVMARKLIFSNGEGGKEMPVPGPVFTKESASHAETIRLEG